MTTTRKWNWFLRSSGLDADAYAVSAIVLDMIDEERNRLTKEAVDVDASSRVKRLLLWVSN